MKNKSGTILIILGAVLILSALSLLLWNRTEDQMAGNQAGEALEQLREHLPATAPASSAPPQETALPDLTRPADMESIPIGGYEYIGYLAIPTLELELPVMAQWDYARLQIAPCRESGGTATNDLVIAAHNYDSHFGRLHRLQPGDWVTFTEVDGFLNTYRVEFCQVLQPDQVEAVLLSEYDLVLYTCTKGGATRVVVYCNREESAGACVITTERIEK